MKKQSPNSYLTTVNVDGHKVDVLLIDAARLNKKEEYWCEAQVQSIDDGSCLSFYKAASLADYQGLCKKAKIEAKKKWHEFIK